MIKNQRLSDERIKFVASHVDIHEKFFKTFRQQRMIAFKFYPETRASDADARQFILCNKVLNCILINFQ